MKNKRKNKLTLNIMEKLATIIIALVAVIGLLYNGYVSNKILSEFSASKYADLEICTNSGTVHFSKIGLMNSRVIPIPLYIRNFGGQDSGVIMISHQESEFFSHGDYSRIENISTGNLFDSNVSVRPNTFNIEKITNFPINLKIDLNIRCDKCKKRNYNKNIDICIYDTTDEGCKKVNECT